MTNKQTQVLTQDCLILEREFLMRVLSTNPILVKEQPIEVVYSGCFCASLALSKACASS